jgi:hypothetical protein
MGLLDSIQGIVGGTAEKSSEAATKAAETVDDAT